MMSDLNDVFPPMIDNIRLMQDKIRRLEYENYELKAAAKEIVKSAVEAETKKRLLEWSALLAENTRMYEEIEKLRAALKLFQPYSIPKNAADTDDLPVLIGDLRAAAAALKEAKNG